MFKVKKKGGRETIQIYFWNAFTSLSNNLKALVKSESTIALTINKVELHPWLVAFKRGWGGGRVGEAEMLTPFDDSIWMKDVLRYVSGEILTKYDGGKSNDEQITFFKKTRKQHKRNYCCTVKRGKWGLEE